MRTFKIVNNDLVFDKSMNFEMVEGVEEIGQCVERILTTNTNEWFLNVLHGLNYDAMQGKGKKEQDIELEIRTAILQEERITNIEYINVKADRKLRHLVVNGKVSTNEYGEIELLEVINFGQ